MSQVIEFHTKIGSDGRIVMPAQCRQALQLLPGDELIIQVHDQEATLFSLKHAVKRAQELVKKHTKGKKSLSKLLIADRRKESEND